MQAWRRIARQRRDGEMASHGGCFVGTVFFPLPYAIMQALSGQEFPFGAFALVAALIVIVAMVAARKSEKGTCIRGFASFSAMMHGVALVAFGAATLR